MTDTLKGSKVMKRVNLKDEITKRYKWALENPDILTISALQAEWVRWVDNEILPKWETDLKEHDSRIKALESRNSLALKATLERIKSKLTDKEVGRYYHRQSMMGNRHKRMVDYALGLALEAVNFEIDSLLQQEGVKT